MADAGMIKNIMYYRRNVLVIEIFQVQYIDSRKIR